MHKRGDFYMSKKKNAVNRLQNEKEYTDVSNVEIQKAYIIPEDLPEGAYGAPRGEDTPVENKSTAWEPDQRAYSAFKLILANKQRNFPGADPTYEEDDRLD